MKESQSSSSQNEFLTHILERERAVNLYLLAKLDSGHSSSFDSLSENSDSNSKLIDFKQQSTDFTNLDSFILQHDLLLAKNRFKLLQLLDDGISGIPALRNNLVRSQVPEDSLANIGSLFL
jgi:hypothetical protein